MTSTSSNRFISYLSLSSFGTVEFGRLQEQIARQFPTIPAAVTPLPGAPSAMGQRGFALSVAGVALVVMFVDAPLPESSYSNALRLNRIWPKDAANAMRAHRAHVVVGMVREINRKTALAEASAVTLLAAALSELLPAAAMIWTTAVSITSPASLRAHAQRLANAVPLDIWLQLEWLDGPPTPDGKRTLAVLTQGLRPFVGRELEFAPWPLDPPTIALRVLGTGEYLIINGPVIKDGDTLGVSESEAIRVRLRDGGQRPGVPIYELNWQSSDQAKMDHNRSH
jgi:hypothetical protein